MTWLIEIVNVVGDEDIILPALKKFGYKIIHEKNKNSEKRFLYNPKNEKIEDANDIYKNARHITETLARFAELTKIPFKIELGAIQKRNSDGSTNRHVFGRLNFTLDAITLKASGSVTPNLNLSNEERKRRAKEAIQRQEVERKLALVSRIASALEIPEVLQVMELLEIDNPNGADLGNIIALVKKAYGKDLSAFATGTDLKRFHHSLNDPKTLGLKARHTVSKNLPPAEPMSFNEAKAFAHRVGRYWLAFIESRE